MTDETKHPKMKHAIFEKQDRRCLVCKKKLIYDRENVWKTHSWNFVDDKRIILCRDCYKHYVSGRMKIPEPTSDVSKITTTFEYWFVRCIAKDMWWIIGLIFAVLLFLLIGAGLLFSLLLSFILRYFIGLIVSLIYAMICSANHKLIPEYND